VSPDAITRLTDSELVARLRNGVIAQPRLVDEYYRRCVPIYLDFLGVHWHTGWYESGPDGPSPRDQERMIERVVSAAGLEPGMQVLDVGCGMGGTAAWLSRHGQVHVVGLTPVPEQKALAEYWLSSQKLNPMPRIVLGHAEALPFDAASFDAIVFFESLCHVQDRAHFMHEAARVLRPGGRLVGEDWLRVGPHGSYADQPGNEALIERVERLWAIPALGSAEHYLALMQAAGFEQAICQDLRSESALYKGFAVTPEQQADLDEQIRQCDNPLLEWVLEGLKALGAAASAGCFTIGRFQAVSRGSRQHAPVI
jgi:ubiquinone/menaquinone biosynthesis C-methylase UbiE